MVHKNLSLSLAVLVLGLSSCNDSSKSVELSIFHTNDIHSHLRPAKSDPFGLGDLSRMSTLLGQLRASSAASITVDAGDWSEGTWYYSLDTGANMLRIMSALGYDASCLGNHDFLSGPDQIIKTINLAKPTFPVLAANLDMSSYVGADALAAALPKSVVKTISGLKVGIIGLTTYEVFYASYMKPVTITNTVEAASKLALQLRPQVDVLIVLSHNSFDSNVELAKLIPGVDAIISGHSHLKVPKAVLVKNAGREVPVVETGAWAKFLGDLKLTVTPGLKTVAFKNYQLHPISPDITKDPAIDAMITAEDARLNQMFGDDVSRVVADSDIDLIQQDAQESSLGNLAVKAYRAATHADLSLEEISLTGVDIAKGPVTLMDLHNVVPHIYNPATGKEWLLHVWNARGSDISLVLNVFYTVSGIAPLSSPLGWMSADNVALTWKPGVTSNNILAVKSILIGGVPLDPTARYTVALHDGLLSALTQANQMLGLGLDLSDITNTGIEAWRAVVDYAASVKKLTIANVGIGAHSRVESSDLAVYSYGIDWDQNQLSVEVHNQGLSPSVPGTVACYTGLPNDFASYATTAQKWTMIAQAPVSVLAVDGATTVQIPWNGSVLASGYWPIKCDVTVAGDTYDPNNHVSKVFKVER